MTHATTLKVSTADTAKMPLEELFDHYLDVCNRAIQKHQHKSPYSELIALGKKLQSDHVHLAVYDDAPRAVYALQFQGNQLAIHPYVSPNLKKAWRVNRSYLEDVVGNPDRYIKHPTLLDLDWLLNRLGV